MSIFKKFTVKELKTICKLNFIEVYSKLKKQQLIDILEQIEEPRLRCVNTLTNKVKLLPKKSTKRSWFALHGWKVEDPSFLGEKVNGFSEFQKLRTEAKEKGMKITNKTKKQDIIDYINSKKKDKTL